MGAESSKDGTGEDKQLRGLVICNRDFSCGGCMDVDNQNTKVQGRGNAPLDENGQLTQPMKKDLRDMIKNQKNSQWQNPADQTYGTSVESSQQQFRSSYRSSANPYGNMRAGGGTLGTSQQSQPVPIQAATELGGPQIVEPSLVKAQKTMKMIDSTHEPKIAATQPEFNIFESKEIQDNFHSNTKGRKQLLAKLVEQANIQTLQLKVLSSAHLEKDFTMMINPMGVVPQQGEALNGAGYQNGPRRQEFDGYTYFGVEDGVKQDDDDVSSKDGAGATGCLIDDATGKQVLKKEMNDFIIPSNNPNNSDASKEQPSINPMMGGNNHQGRQFYIQFDPLDRLYKIRDLGKGYGAFAKLQGSIIIRDSFLVNIGESYVVSYLINNADESQNSGREGHIPYKLKLKIFPPYNLESPDVVICQNSEQELVIGRSPNCDIRIDDQLISKMQSTIKYEDGNWILEDGRDGKESTNGTWYYLNQEQAIQDGMIFKQNQTFFVANFV